MLSIFLFENDKFCFMLLSKSVNTTVVKREKLVKERKKGKRSRRDGNNFPGKIVNLDMNLSE